MREIIKRIALLMVFSSGMVALAGESSGPWNAWLSSQATPKTRELTRLNDDGDVQSVVTTSEYDIRVKQVNIEERTRGEDNQLHLTRQRRTTEVVDVHGGKYTLQEERAGLSDALIPRQITEEIRTATRNVTTVRTINDKDQLILSRRTTREQLEDGSVVTTVEARDRDGNMTVIQRQVER